MPQHPVPVCLEDAVSFQVNIHDVRLARLKDVVVGLDFLPLMVLFELVVRRNRPCLLQELFGL